MRAKRIFCLLFVAALGIALIPWPARADSQTVGDFVVTTSSTSGYAYDSSSRTLIFTAAGSYTVSTRSGVTTTQDNIIIDGGSQSNPIEITLSAVNISAQNRNSFYMANPSHVRLILAAGTTNIISSNLGAGITCLSASTLIIDGGGSLKATGPDAGIGGGFDEINETYDSGSGAIHIRGGTIEASSTQHGAGIGGSSAALNCGPVTISGGTVTAYGGTYCPGIGPGVDNHTWDRGSASKITISGGTVTATGGDHGAGIGGAYVGGISGTPVGPILISGGRVSASGKDGGAGIGGGRNGSGDQITISGGTVTATGSQNAAGIGGGYSGDSGQVRITGGTVLASGGSGGAGIGCGRDRSNCCVIITGGSIKAQGKDGGQDIGTGNNYSGNKANPTNGPDKGNQPVYLTRVTLLGLTAQTGVAALQQDAGYPYGCGGMKTDGSGLLYLYLPSGTETTAAATSDGTYTGSITTTGDHQTAGTLEKLGYIQLASPKGLAWNKDEPWLAVWNPVAGASGYRVWLCHEGIQQGEVIQVSEANCDLDQALHDAGNDASYTYKVQALGDGATYHDSPVSLESPVHYFRDPWISSPDNPVVQAVKNQPFSCAFAAVGRQPCIFTFEPVTPSSLWSSFSMSEDGILTGLPSSAVGGNFYVYATNNYSTTQRLYTLSVKDPDQVPVLGMASMLAWDETFPGLASWGPVNGAAAYRLQLYRDSDPQGDPVDVTAGREYDFLPAIEETGTGIYHFSVTALGDGVNYVDGPSTGPSEAGYDYTAPLATPAITTLALPEADLNGDYSQILTATGDPPISWSVTEGSLPAGLSLSRIGLLAGKPVSGGNFTFTVQAKNAAGSDTCTCTLSVREPEKILVGHFSFTPITGLVNGTAKTAEALGLPETGTLATQYSQVEAAVNWNLDSCSYDPDDKDAQTFHVYGSFVLPEGVINPYGIPLTTGIMVTVLEEVIPVYTVIYDGNGATGGATSNSVHVIGQAQKLTKNGFNRNFYLFAGWSLTAGGQILFLDEESVIDLSSLDGDTVTLYAAWQPVSYSIVYELDGGAAGNPSSYTVESDEIELNPPQKTGYAFTGWSGTGISGQTMEVIIPQGSTGDRIYTAHWQPLVFSVFYQLEGGAADNPSSYTIESNEIELNPPQKTGYAFTGWSGTGISGQTMEVIIPQGSTGDRIYTAHWQLLSFFIDYGLQGGTTDNPASYTVESNEIKLNPPHRAGYDFTGWSGTGISGQTMEVIIPQGSTGDRTYTAHWQSLSFSIFYELEGGSADNPASYTIESGDIRLNRPKKSGHAFMGWSGTDIPAFAMEATIPGGSMGDRIYTAHWEKITGLQASFSMNLGESITWDPKPDGGTWEWDREFFSASFNSPATFTALKAGSSTITYSVGGGSQSVTVTILAAEKIPGTGQRVWAGWLMGLCWLSLAAGAQMLRKKRENFTS